MTPAVDRNPLNRRQEQIRRALAWLDQVPGLRPVTDGEGRLFAAHDLASLAETAFGEPLDPLGLTGTAVKDLARRLDCPVDEVDPYRRRYWILDAGEAVGTVAVDDHPLGWNDLQLSSLYLRPPWRARGLGAATVEAVFQAAVTAQLNAVRLTADWLRPRSVGFYLHLGFHVSHWKHAIHMVRRPDAPRLRYHVDGPQRRLLADIGGAERPLLTATRKGPWLRLEEHPPSGAPNADQFARDALATMAVHLALESFPLIRDPARWQEAYRWTEGGEPEGLARRIWFFERYARRQGHLVDTPDQVLPPGLSWPAWD